MTFAEIFRFAGSGLRTVKFLTSLLRPEIDSMWSLDPWPEESLIDCDTRSAHRLAYVCVRIANRSRRVFYPKTIELEYRPKGRFHFSRVRPAFELREDAPPEIPPGEEREVDFGTVTQQLAVLLYENGAGTRPLLRPIIVDHMGRLFPGRPDPFDVEKWRLGRKLTDEEFEYLTG